MKWWQRVEGEKDVYGTHKNKYRELGETNVGYQSLS